MLEALLDERGRRSLVTLPPEGATLHEIERAALVAALDRTGWVQAQAAKMLGMTARALNSKMLRYCLYEDNPVGPRVRKVYRNPRGSRGRPPSPRVAGKDWRLRAADVH